MMLKPEEGDMSIRDLRVVYGEIILGEAYKSLWTSPNAGATHRNRRADVCDVCLVQNYRACTSHLLLLTWCPRFAGQTTIVAAVGWRQKLKIGLTKQELVSDEDRKKYIYSSGCILKMFPQLVMLVCFCSLTQKKLHKTYEKDSEKPLSVNVLCWRSDRL